MLKKSASSVLNIREASFVPDSDASRFTFHDDEDGLFEHPEKDILLYVSRTDHRNSRVSARFSTAC